jgi:undecaprenyl-diphosphatase
MKRKIAVGCIELAAFVLWTAAVCLVDVQPIGPEGSAVGFAAVNGFVHDLTGVNMTLYVITDWLSVIPLGVVMGFAALGLRQWIQRKSLWKVDRSILALGVFYLAVGAVFVFFEIVAVNFRPVLIDGVLEASYPSSTTMLVLCVMGTGAVQWRDRIKYPVFRGLVMAAVSLFMVFMVAGRLLSGVHWLTDIIGGGLISCGLIAVYDGVKNC